MASSTLLDRFADRLQKTRLFIQLHYTKKKKLDEEKEDNKKKETNGSNDLIKRPAQCMSPLEKWLIFAAFNNFESHSVIYNYFKNSASVGENLNIYA